MIINLLNLNLVNACQSFETTKTAIDAVKTMRTIQKGQLHYADKDIYAQNKLINQIFELAA